MVNGPGSIVAAVSPLIPWSNHHSLMGENLIAIIPMSLFCLSGGGAVSFLGILLDKLWNICFLLSGGHLDPYDLRLSSLLCDVTCMMWQDSKPSSSRVETTEAHMQWLV